jgi:hypothetical protein
LTYTSPAIPAVANMATSTITRMNSGELRINYNPSTTRKSAGIITYAPLIFPALALRLRDESGSG